MASGKVNTKMGFYLIPLGIAVNFVLGQIVTLLRLPVYFDAVGTMVVGALCGPVYSIIAALATGALLSITSPSNWFYMANYLAVGITAGLFAKWGFFKKLPKSVIYGIIIGVICGVAGSAVTVAVYGGYTASPTGIITGAIVKTFHLGLFTANTISECFSDIIDKIPSAIIAFLIVKAVPNRFLLKLPYGNEYIHGMNRTENGE
ncbi:MAG: hypothetical protein PHE02_02660 [Lachnospiraceae bacterium]|nr:hypothetical protein [Lachnospiraceae bacterium]